MIKIIEPLQVRAWLESLSCSFYRFIIIFALRHDNYAFSLARGSSIKPSLSNAMISREDSPEPLIFHSFC